MFTTKHYTIAALAIAASAMSALPSYAGGCHRGGPVFGGGYCAPAYCPPPYYPAPAYCQPVYYSPYAPQQFPVNPGFRAAPLAAPVAGAAPLANVNGPAVVGNNAPPLGALPANVGAAVAARGNVVGGPVGGPAVAGAPVGGAAGIAPRGPVNGGPALQGNGSPTILSVPANPALPKVEGVSATPPGPVGALTAFNVGLQTPVTNAAITNQANQPVLRSPRFEE